MATAAATGALLGLFMASVFITASMLTLFFLIKNMPPGLAPFFQRHPPAKVAMGIVGASYPLWAVIGGILGLLYKISADNAPGGGMGSPNMVFTAAIVVVTVMMAAPVMALLRRVMAGVAAIALIFAGVFGWFLPHFLA